MKIGTALRAINKHAAIYVYLTALFAFCWLLHFGAIMKMEARGRFALMNDETLRAMAWIDWVAARSWLAIAYMFLVIASIAFLQIRGRREWTWWATAIVYGIPCAVYGERCAYIAGKLLG